MKQQLYRHLATNNQSHIAALKSAQASFEAIAGLLQVYPRPSNDPNGRLLLDAREHAKAAARVIRQVLGGTDEQA